MKPDEPNRFDELAKALATTTTRRQALKAFASTALGGLVVGVRIDADSGAALAATCVPNTQCASFCASVFGANTRRALECAREAAKCRGLCYTCGPGNGNPKNLKPCPGGTLPGTIFPGSCCTVPANGTATCTSRGTCGFTCSSGYTACNGQCVNTTTDPNNCGTCGNACASGQTCSGGTCVCNATSCPSGCCDSSGTCQPGAAATACGSGGAACVTCTTSVANATATCSSGTCTFTCNQGYTLCSGTCVDTGSDSNNCGGCGQTCTTANVANSTAVTCSGGACVATACASGYTLCSGTCVDTNTDANNCGTCGNVCPSGSTCQNGTCQSGPCDCSNLNYCSGHGTCTASCTCTCDPGYSGADCSNTAPPPTCASYTTCTECNANASQGCVFCQSTLEGASGVCTTASDCLIPQSTCS